MGTNYVGLFMPPLVRYNSRPRLPHDYSVSYVLLNRWNHSLNAKSRCYACLGKDNRTSRLPTNSMSAKRL